MKKIFLIAILLVTQIVFGQQYARPSSDTDVPAGWNGLFEDINEVVPDNSDFGWSDDGLSDTYETKLSSVTDPISSIAHIVSVNFSKSDGGVAGSTSGSESTVTISLYQGITLIQLLASSITLGVWTRGDYTLSGGNTDNITDYSDLRVRFVFSGGGGSPTNKRGIAISWVQLEVPDAPAPSSRRIFNIN